MIVIFKSWKVKDQGKAEVEEMIAKLDKVCCEVEINITN